jgi:hypothetical protein
MSADEMPCGCLGHADNANLCQFPALKARAERLEKALRWAHEWMDMEGHSCDVDCTIAAALREGKP